jgi:hypothetical protein
MTGEPPLGAAQAALVEAATFRLHHAKGSFTPHDLSVLRWLTDVLGFKKRFTGS